MTRHTVREPDPAPADAVLARTTALAALVAVVALLLPLGASALPRLAAKRFERATSCICHSEQQADWERSMHAKALSDPVYVVEKAQAKVAGGAALGVFCDTCHTPIGTMAGQTTPGKKLSAQSKEGVTCDFCHQVTGTTHPIGGASQTLRGNGKKRAQLKGASSPTHVNVYSAFHTTAEFCGSCHSLKHPTTGVVLDSTYEEWKAGPYAEAGIVCQDCHMGLGAGTGPTTGRAAAMGPIRSNIFLMSFVGANVALGDPERARGNLTAAARVTIKAPDIIKNGESGTVAVTVENVGAGHSIPGGAAEIRQMWLEVSAISADGTRERLVRRDFGRVLKDSDGHSPAHAWNAAGVESEDRIPPKESRDTGVEFTMKTSGKVTIEAVLNYRSFSDELARKARVENPTTQMARSEAVVFGSESARLAAKGRLNGTSLLLVLALGAVVLLALAGGGAAWLRRRSRPRADAFGRS